MRGSVLGLFVFLLLAMGLVVWANPNQVHVNAGWTGPENCGGHTWQTDAFATIQAGITAVAEGGTVTVMAGVYPERLTIDKPLSLLGPKTGVDPNAPTTEDPFAANPARGDPAQEAVIRPPTNNVTDPTSFLIAVQADQVTITGLTLDGAAGLEGGVTLNEIAINQVHGIGNHGGHVSGILISHNILRNFVGHAIHFDNQNTEVRLTASNAILYNRIDNVPFCGDEMEAANPPAYYGTGIRVLTEFYTIAHNTLTRVSVGADVRSLWHGTGGFAPEVSNNRIQAYNIGLHFALYHDRALQGDAPHLLVDGNTVTITPRAALPPIVSCGISLLYIEHDARVLLRDNTLCGGKAGLVCWEISPYDDGQVTVSGGTIRDVLDGVVLYNYLDIGDFGPAKATGVTLTGVTMTEVTHAGLVIEDDARALGPSVVTASNVTVEGGLYGVLLKGGRATVTGSLHLVGQTQQAIRLENGAVQPTVTLR
jgi:hypothetical protein